MNDARTNAGQGDAPEGVLLPLPDFEQLTPLERPDANERVVERAAAFYNAIDEAVEACSGAFTAGHDPRPRTTDVWLDPHDAAAFRRWVALPMSDDPTTPAGSGEGWHWRLMHPTVSEHVPVGYVIVTPRRPADGGSV